MAILCACIEDDLAGESWCTGKMCLYRDCACIEHACIEHLLYRDIEYGRNPGCAPPAKTNRVGMCGCPPTSHPPLPAGGCIHPKAGGSSRGRRATNHSWERARSRESGGLGTIKWSSRIGGQYMFVISTPLEDEFVWSTTFTVEFTFNLPLFLNVIIYEIPYPFTQPLFN